MDSQSSPDGGGGGGGSEFPVGLRVLVVDDDPTCLMIIDRMLKACRYRVTTCSRAVVALDILREKKGGFDIVLSDVYMPDMDGFKLLEHIGLEMDLPVIMMSADDGKDVVMKGVTHGACDYLIKPVSIEALKNIWQHVFRKKRNELKDIENSGSVEESDKQRKLADDADNASSANESSWKNVKRKKEGEEEDEFEEREDTSTLKKPRVVWSVELHQQFVAAVNQLGLDKAVPKKILELMSNPALTRENVASHLQKYRLYLKRITVPQHQGRADASFSNSPDASSFSSITSLDGFDIQALAASGQIPPQALMNLHSGPRRPANICADMSTVDQRAFFNSDTQLANSSKIRPTVVQQVNNSQVNLLYGPSASMEPRQIGQVQQMFRSYGNMGLQVSEGPQGFSSLPTSMRTSSSFSGGIMNGHATNSFVVQMNQQGPHISLAQQQDHIQIGIPRQPRPRGQLLNGTSSEHDSRVSSTMGQQIVSNGIPNHVLVRTGAVMNGGASLQGNYMNMSPYCPVPQALYPNTQNNSMGGLSCHPHVNSTVAANHTSSGMMQESINAAPGGLEVLDNVVSLKGGKDVIPSYDIFSDLHENKHQDWKLQNMNLSYESSQRLGTKQDYGSSVATHQDFNATLKDGAARNTCTVRKEIFSIRTEIEHEKVECVSQDALFPDDGFSNELMSVFGKQEDTVGQVEPEFNFEKYSFET